MTDSAAPDRARIAGSPTPEEARAYWDHRAADYPRPDRPEDAAEARALRDAADALGARFDVAAILDVGAGSGLHAAGFAGRAGRVVALDLSPGMLAALAALALPNVETVAADWGAVDLAAQGWVGAFDLVWAAMTPAVLRPGGLERLEAASRGQVCVVTWGARRDDPLSAEVRALHGVDASPPPWRDRLGAWLAGRPHRRGAHARAFDMGKSLDATVADFLTHLRWEGVADPDEARLRALLAPRAIGGVVPRPVSADLDIWLWDAP